jgi:hypothetical protein
MTQLSSFDAIMKTFFIPDLSMTRLHMTLERYSSKNKTTIRESPVFTFDTLEEALECSFVKSGASEYEQLMRMYTEANVLIERQTSMMQGLKSANRHAANASAYAMALLLNDAKTSEKLKEELLPMLPYFEHIIKRSISDDATIPEEVDVSDKPTVAMKAVNETTTVVNEHTGIQMVTQTGIQMVTQTGIQTGMQTGMQAGIQMVTQTATQGTQTDTAAFTLDSTQMIIGPDKIIDSPPEHEYPSVRKHASINEDAVPIITKNGNSDDISLHTEAQKQSSMKEFASNVITNNENSDYISLDTTEAQKQSSMKESAANIIPQANEQAAQAAVEDLALVKARVDVQTALAGAQDRASALALLKSEAQDLADQAAVDDRALETARVDVQTALAEAKARASDLALLQSEAQKLAAQAAVEDLALAGAQAKAQEWASAMALLKSQVRDQAAHEAVVDDLAQVDAQAPVVEDTKRAAPKRKPTTTGDNHLLHASDDRRPRKFITIKRKLESDQKSPKRTKTSSAEDENEVAARFPVDDGEDEGNYAFEVPLLPLPVDDDDLPPLPSNGEDGDDD